MIDNIKTTVQDILILGVFVKVHKSTDRETLSVKRQQPITSSVTSRLSRGRYDITCNGHFVFCTYFY